MNRIILKKPSISSLKKQGYMCFDMHVHSEYSLDSNSKVKSIVKRAKQLGIGIAITDHNDIRGCLEAYKINKNIIIPGIEARSKEGFDLLFYFYKINELKDFYKKVIEPDKKKIGGSKLPALDLIEKSKPYKNIACIAHPYRPSPRRIINAIFKSKTIKQIFNKIKTIEAINSKNFRIFNNKAIIFSKKKNKRITGGSDSHDIKGIGAVITCIKEKKISRVLDQIASNNVIVIGKELNLIIIIIKTIFEIIKKKIH